MVLELVDRVLSAIHPRSFRALLQDLGATTRPDDYQIYQGNFSRHQKLYNTTATFFFN